MAFRHLCILGLLLAFGARPLLADPQLDLKSRCKLFCGPNVKLTEASIKFDVEKLVSLEAGSKAAAPLQSESIVQVALMHMACSLLVGGYLTTEQFLATQTQVLQYAVDLQTVRQLAEAKQAAENKATSPTSGATATGPQASPGSQTESATTSKGPGEAPKKEPEGTPPSTPRQKPEQGKTSPAQKPANLDIDAIAKDLGVKLKHKTAVVQSGNEDLVESGMQRLIENYSPIKVNN